MPNLDGTGPLNYGWGRGRGRPKRLRCVRFQPGVTYFKPRGIPLIELETVTLALDEVEALRLADLNNLEQVEAAQQMKISQSTFQRILTAARQKISQALIRGMAIKIGGAIV